MYKKIMGVACIILLAACSNQEAQDDIQEEGVVMAQQQDLSYDAENTWVLEAWNEGDYNLDLIQATLIFDPDTLQVSGFAGCNQYQAEYVDNPDGTQTIANIAATRMYCPEPDNIMDFEQTFLTTLSEPHSVQQNGNTLIWTTIPSGQLMTFRLFSDMDSE